MSTRSNRDQESVTAASSVASDTVPPSPVPSIPISSNIGAINSNANNDDDQLKKAEDRLMKYLKTKFPDEEEDRNGIEWEAIGMLAEFFPQVFAKKYEFDCLEGPTYPVGIICGLNPPEGVLESVYNASQGAVKLSFYHACLWGSSSVQSLIWLHRKEPDVVAASRDDFYGRVPLFAAIQSDSLELVTLIFELNPNSINHRDVRGSTPLHVACGVASVDIVKYILSKMNANGLQVRDDVFGTPLELSLMRVDGDTSVAKLLLQEKTPEELLLNEPDEQGYLPLHIACLCSENFECVKLILAADPEAAKKKTNYNGKLPLALAVENENMSENQKHGVYKLLIEEYPESLDEKLSNGDRQFDTEMMAAYMKIEAKNNKKKTSRKRRRADS